MQIARFTVAYWCVLVAALLPLVCAGVGKFGQFGKPGREDGYDNANPRAWWARQTDWRARANAAMANTFEALPFFLRQSSLPICWVRTRSVWTSWHSCLCCCASCTS